MRFPPTPPSCSRFRTVTMHSFTRPFSRPRSWHSLGSDSRLTSYSKGVQFLNVKRGDRQERLPQKRGRETEQHAATCGTPSPRQQLHRNRDEGRKARQPRQTARAPTLRSVAREDGLAWPKPPRDRRAQSNDPRRDTTMRYHATCDSITYPTPRHFAREDGQSLTPGLQRNIGSWLWRSHDRLSMRLQLRPRWSRACLPILPPEARALKSGSL